MPCLQVSSIRSDDVIYINRFAATWVSFFLNPNRSLFLGGRFNGGKCRYSVNWKVSNIFSASLP